MWHLRQVIQLKFCLNSNDLLGHQRARQTQMTTAKQKSNSCKRNCLVPVYHFFCIKNIAANGLGPGGLGLVSGIFLCESTEKPKPLNHWLKILRFGLSFFWH